MNKLIYKNLSLLSQIIFFASLAISLSGALIYPNFFLNKFKVQPLVVYLIYVVISFLNKIFQSKKTKEVDLNNHKIYMLLSIVFGFGYLFFNALESMTYTNFVFSKFHIHPLMLLYPFLISFSEYFLTTNFNKAGRSIKRFLLSLLNINTILIPLLIIMFVNNIFGSFSKVKDDIYFMVTNINASRHLKYEFKLGKLFYRYVNFIIDNTESNSRIMIPPFPTYPWPQTGNAVYMRYFLYPRALLSGNEYSAIDNISKFDYVLVAWGETTTTTKGYTHGWPKFDVKAEYVLYLQDDGSIKKVVGDYIYKKVEGQVLWGLIKVKK